MSSSPHSKGSSVGGMDSMNIIPHLIDIAKTFREMASIIKSNAVEKADRKFYSSFMVLCFLVQDHVSRVGSTLDSSTIRSVLDRFQTLIRQSHLNVVENDSLSQLWSLRQRFSQISSESLATRLEFVCSCLDFGSPEQRDDLLDFLLKWTDNFLIQYPEDRSLLLEEDAVQPAKRDNEPSYAVCAAAQALYDALIASEACKCEHIHGYSARLCLKTYRKDNLCLDHDFEFDMFLALEQFWQEMQVRTVGKSVVKFALNEATKAKPEAPPNVQRMKVKELCKIIRKSMLSKKPLLRLNCLVENRQLWKLLSGKTNHPIDRAKTPVTLEQFITTNPGYLNEKVKRILAVLMGSTVLNLYGTPWLQSTWGSSNIVFFYTQSSAIPLRPFIQVSLMGISNGFVPHEAGIDEDDADDPDPDDLFAHHPCPPLVVLATILMEVHMATSFKMLAKTYNVDLANPEGGNPQYPEVLEVFNKCQWEIPQQTRSAMNNCLKPSLWEDDNFNVLDDEMLRGNLYEYLVRLLEEKLSTTFSYISLEELDNVAQNLDLGNWGRTIQNNQVNIQSGPAFLETPNQLWNSADSLLQLRDISKSKVSVQDQKQIIRDPRTTMSFFDDEGSSEEMSKNARDAYQRWKDNYNEVYERFITSHPEPSPNKSIRIAVLDTGLDMSHQDFVARKENIKKRYNWTDSRKIDDVQDFSGHGTHVAGLILDFAPDAELYVAKIAEKDPSDPRTIAAAIDYAVQRWEVDIISMSFGFPGRELNGYEDLYMAIENAHHAGKLLFCAASNSGANLDRAYPARHAEVICIHSVDANGNRSKFSPTPSSEDANFATIGEVVESAWPGHLCDKKTLSIHKSGTSFATPIAVGIAGFLLEYSKLYLSPEYCKKLRKPAGMRAVLKTIARSGPDSAKRDGYTYLAPSLYSDNLFGNSEAYIKESIEKALRSS